jgi:hypothetical protein
LPNQQKTNAVNYKDKKMKKNIISTDLSLIKYRTIVPRFLIVLALVALAIGASTANGAPGDLFEADFNSGTIYKFASDGTRSTFATGLVSPVGLAFDSAGNLFAADFLGGTIYKFAPDGTRSTFATGLLAPVGLAFDSAGNLFEADSDSSTINKFAPDGTRSIFATGRYPVGLAFDSAGNLFEADLMGNTIYKFAPDGTQSTFATGLRPFGLAFDSAGNLFATDDGTIYKFAPDGTQSTFATGLSGPAFLAFQPEATTSYAAQVQQPINADGTSVFSVRRGVVPVKFTLNQGGVATCDLPPATIAVTRTSGGTTGAVDESVYSGSADNGSNFRVDNCQYVYNLSPSALGVGTYRVDITINGQVVGSATFQLN